MEMVKYFPLTDKLILLGDYVDRGLNSKKVLEHVIDLKKHCGAVVLRGNHDQMAIDAFDKGEDGLWLNNGGLTTVQSYVGTGYFEEGFDWVEYLKAKEFIRKNYYHHIEFLKSLPLFHETDEHIFVHAGLHPMYEDWRQQPAEDFIWIRDIFLNNPTTVDKTVIFGHTPTMTLHDSADIWFGEDKIAIDGACAYGYQLNCLEICDDGYKSHVVKRNKK